MQTSLNFKDSIFPGAKCARDLQLPNWLIIEECANSTQGSKLLQKYGEMTSILTKPIDVPVITFNNVCLMFKLILGRSFEQNRYQLKIVSFIYCSILTQTKVFLQEKT